MREILFRGQTRRNGEKVWMTGEKVPSNWVYGGIFQGAGDFSVIYGATKEDFTGADIEKHVVYTNSIGQFTGLTDKNGKRIFEGDIVEATIIRDMGGGEETRKEIGMIAYDGIGMIGIVVERYDGQNIWSDFFQELTLSGCIFDFGFEVIGNIHDNPEMLEVGDE